MATRALILEKAAELLASSPDGTVSTRAVCEAAGVGQPVLYRLFGDKDGLMSAVVDQVWDEYLTMKRAATPSADPLDDLRRGWDAHTAFALAHPHAYRLVFGTTLTTTPEAPAEAMALLRGVLDRLAAQGRLRLPPDDAARVVMAANSGVALGLLLRPGSYPDAAISTLTRQAVERAVLADAGPADDAPAVAATTLRAHLRETERFSAGEAALLDEWLARLQTPPAADRPHLTAPDRT
ncbi:TetR/AcrR family transcriptional regulator [Cellulomonas algicola]|uniref:TetR/AcrR family transcriptional regulator n=1 Tax=Cellulomonas algicola TaxID=2071633 RepID=UPI001C3F9EB7|nr:TetR/AcrR family transcriptional regulator [Cellulomonas algicola]